MKTITIAKTKTGSRATRPVRSLGCIARRRRSAPGPAGPTGGESGVMPSEGIGSSERGGTGWLRAEPETGTQQSSMM